MMLDGALELAVGEDVKVLADCLIIVATHDDIRASSSRLQAGIERFPCTGSTIKVDSRTVMTRWQLHTQLNTQIVRGQYPLIIPDEPDVTETRTVRAAELGQRLRRIKLAVS